MSHPIVHAEIRSSDPDATRAFFGDLFGWTYPNEGAFPGYTFVETGVPGALYTAISPLQGDGDLVTFFVGVDDMADAIANATRLGGRVVQEPVTVPGVSFALIADPPGSRGGPGPAALSSGSDRLRRQGHRQVHAQSA
jgi:predicted enzyme related to lactoylglutathione lyase